MESDRKGPDIEVFGASTRWDVVRADTRDSRSWLLDSPVCPILGSHHIAHVGRMWAKPPFEVARVEASGTFMLVGLKGEGETLVDGNWRLIKEGQMCLLPAFAHTRIRAKNSRVWNFAWVRYEETRERAPILSRNSPVIHSGNVETLNHAIAGLISEVTEQIPDPSSVHHWVELIHGFVSKTALPYKGDDRLWRVWDAVSNDLAQDWTLSALARIGHISSEHIRRLSQQQIGRSPLQHVTYLRMRRAVELLTSTDDKLESIAYGVGYQNPFTFSNAFKRWTGMRPSDYRSSATTNATVKTCK